MSSAACVRASTVKKEKKTVCELGNISRQALRVRFAKHFISGIHLRSSSPSSFSCRARNIAGISQSHVSRHFLNGALLVGRRQIEKPQSHLWIWNSSMEGYDTRNAARESYISITRDVGNGMKETSCLKSTATSYG